MLKESSPLALIGTAALVLFLVATAVNGTATGQLARGMFSQAGNFLEQLGPEDQPDYDGPELPAANPDLPPPAESTDECETEGRVVRPWCYQVDRDNGDTTFDAPEPPPDSPTTHTVPEVPSTTVPIVAETTVPPTMAPTTTTSTTSPDVLVAAG